eukprot:COSAG03_NODE_2832_length_2424_cov_3.657204_4_plen_37_part_01
MQQVGDPIHRAVGEKDPDKDWVWTYHYPVTNTLAQCM